jgi:hypothetical protein
VRIARDAALSMRHCAAWSRWDRHRTDASTNRRSYCAGHRRKMDNERVHSMLYTIAVVLVIMWLLGLVTSYTMGGFIHILLVVAVIMILVNLISGRRTL